MTELEPKDVQILNVNEEFPENLIVGINANFEKQEDNTYICKIVSAEDDNILLKSFLCCLDQIKESNPKVFETIEKVIFNQAIKDCEEYRKQFEENVKKDMKLQKQIPSNGITH